MKLWMVAAYGVVAGWSGLTWVVGGKVESGYQQHVEMLQGDTFGLHVVEQKFNRGFLTSESTTTLELKPDPCKDKGLRLIVREKIRNDLVTGLGAVRSDITLEFPSAVERELKKLLGERKAATITGVYSLNGDVAYHLDSPAMNLPVDNGGEFRWKGMVMDLTSSGGEQRLSLNSKGLEVMKSGETFMLLDDLNINSTSEKTAIDLNVGRNEATLGRFEIAQMSPAMKAITVENTKVSSALSLKSGKAFITADYALGNISIGDEEGGSMSASLSFNRLDTDGLKKFMAAMKEAGQTCKPEADLYLDAFKGLLNGSPELLVNRIELQFGDKEMSVDGHIKGLDLGNVSGRDWSSLAQSGNFEGLDLRLRVKVNQPFVDQMDAMKNASGGQGRLGQLPSGSALQREGDRYVGELEYKNGEMLLNGTPLSRLTAPASPFDTPASAEEAATGEEEDVLAEWRRPGSSF